MRNESLGNLKSWEKVNDQLYLLATNAFVNITFFNNNIANICISKNKIEKHPFSYAVNVIPHESNYSVKDSEKNIEISNANFILQIQKFPLRIQFLTLDRNPICIDDPAFGTSWLGNEVSTYKSLQPNERFIGLGEKTGNLDRKGKAYTNWNTDHFAYGTEADPLYCSIPFYIGIHNQICYGIFFDNSHKTTFNFGASNNRFLSFSAESGEMNYYFIFGKNVSQILHQYSLLTGRIALPSLWSLGLHQCRYSYYPDKELLRIAQTFREKEIPCDALWLDIHYMHQYKVFTFDSKKFSNPKQLTEDLRKLNFKTVVIVDPGIKNEKGYEVYEDGLKNNVFVAYPDKSNYEAEVWPGWSCFPDFTHPDVRNWWANWMKFYIENGIEGFWNDMNEPASWGQHTPDLIEFHYEGEVSSHKKARNVYGMQMARATYEGTKNQMQNKRPFVLTRAGYAGIQRYAALWTGDNVATDEHMLLGVRLVNSLGLSGVPFAGYDVAGFAGEASAELFARWISIAAFSPFFRCHSMINSKSAEPWSFGEKTFEIAQNYIRLRYQLLPYIYSAFYEASQTGIPVNRSLAIYWPHDEKIYHQTYQNQYLFGQSILVAPVESNKELTKVYLPEGNWYDFYTDTLYEGKQEIIVESPLEKLPLFIKEGSVIPMQSVIQSANETTDTVLYLHCYYGASRNKITYYEDDGVSFNYQKDVFYKREISLENTRLELSQVIGKYSSKFKNLKIYFHGKNHLQKINVNTKELTTQVEKFCFLNPISNFDPFIKTSSLESGIKITTATLPLLPDKNIIEL